MQAYSKRFLIRRSAVSGLLYLPYLGAKPSSCVAPRFGGKNLARVRNILR